MSDEETPVSEEALAAEPEPLAEPEPVTEVPAAPVPVRWYRVEFVAPAGMRTPVQAAGRSWFERSVHILPESCAHHLAAQPHFTILSETAQPAGPSPCPDCGKPGGS